MERGQAPRVFKKEGNDDDDYNFCFYRKSLEMFHERGVIDIVYFNILWYTLVIKKQWRYFTIFDKLFNEGSTFFSISCFCPQENVKQ